jgi:hypothetical protein
MPLQKLISTLSLRIPILRQIRGGAGRFHLMIYLEVGGLVVKSHLMTEVGKGVCEIS